MPAGETVIGVDAKVVLKTWAWIGENQSLGKQLLPCLVVSADLSGDRCLD